MHRFWLILAITSLLFTGCPQGGNGDDNPINPPHGGGDTDAPEWTDSPGITAAVAGDGEVTVQFSYAIDDDSPPIKYLIYFDTDDDPWDQEPTVVNLFDPVTISGLTNGTKYWFGVRVRDSAMPSNVDDNTKVIPAMPILGGLTADTDPPEWDDTVGVVSVVPGDSEIIVNWGTATDFVNPPVEYLVYHDEDSDPWDQEPEISSDSPLTVTDLTSGVQYSFGVRCRDSADPPNVDNNTVVAFAVPEESDGWARTWGGNENDIGQSVAVDQSGNMYVVGSYAETVDFDPGTSVDSHTSNGDLDCFLVKLNSLGEFLWAQTWGGSSDDIPYGITAGNSGTVYIIGEFTGTVDFDPTSGSDNHESEGSRDIFLSAIADTGMYQWSRTWGGTQDDYGMDVAVDPSGNIYTIGSFKTYYPGTVDFNPGSGQDLHSSIGSIDAFLSSLDSAGNFRWAKTWGGFDNDWARGVACDSGGNVFVTGEFAETCDFDPGPGEEIHIANGLVDCFLSKFTSAGTSDWALTWGGGWYDFGLSVTTNIENNVYVSGMSSDTVDFDPGPGTDIHDGGAFVSKFDPSGTYNWALTWGTIDDRGSGVAVDEDGNVFVTGSFKGTVDFDPGVGVELHTSSGGALDRDAYTSRFDSDGTLDWVITWGGVSDDMANGISLDNSGNPIVTGWFRAIVDFHPGESVETHTSEGISDAFLVRYKSDGGW